MSVKTDTENKKGMLVFGQLPQTSAKEAAELEASCLKEAWSKKAWEDALEDKNAAFWWEFSYDEILPDSKDGKIRHHLIDEIKW